MSNTYDGGPAFPSHHFDLADNEHGMALRDYFAAKAMQGTAAHYCHDDSRYGTWEEQLAVDSYAIADAMIAVRDKK